MANYDNLLANVPTDLWIGGKWRKASDGDREHHRLGGERERR
jgi:succinate-semialdehyde dehydrogenase/glutarate-semialdehyde dehydrogenase